MKKTKEETLKELKDLRSKNTGAIGINYAIRLVQSIDVGKEEHVAKENNGYRVKIGFLYFIGWAEDGTQPFFTIDNFPESKSLGRIFKSRTEAYLVAGIIGGEVEEVEDEE